MEGALVERFLRRVAEVAAAQRPESVLDVGCGEGHVTARLPGARIVGVDPDPRALEAAARRVPAGEFRRAAVTALPFDDGAFDLVVCTQVLEHLEDPAAALDELRRVARRAVLVTVPHEPWFRLGNLARGRHARRLGSTPGHVHTWTRRSFRRLAGGEWFGAFPWQGRLARYR